MPFLAGKPSRAGKPSKDPLDIAQAILSGKDNAVQQMGNRDLVYNAFVPKAVEGASALKDAIQRNVKQEDIDPLIPHVKNAEKWMFRIPECKRKSDLGYVGTLDLDAFKWKCYLLDPLLKELTENLEKTAKLVRSATEKSPSFESVGSSSKSRESFTPGFYLKPTALPQLITSHVLPVRRYEVAARKVIIRGGYVPLMRYVPRMSADSSEEAQDPDDVEFNVDSPKTVGDIVDSMFVDPVMEEDLKSIRGQGNDVTVWANGHRLSRDEPIPDGCDVELVVVEVDEEAKYREYIFKECARKSQMGLCRDEMLMLGDMIGVGREEMRTIYDCLCADASDSMPAIPTQIVIPDSVAGDATIPKVKVEGLLHQYTLDEMKDFLQWGHEKQDGVYCEEGHRYVRFVPGGNRQCDICHSEAVQVPHMWMCKACDYDLCFKCFGESFPSPTQTSSE